MLLESQEEAPISMKTGLQVIRVMVHVFIYSQFSLPQSLLEISESFKANNGKKHYK